MANLGEKDGIFHIRFRFGGKEFKKSLKIRDKSFAEAAKNMVELTIHRLLTEQILLPCQIDAGAFILSGGTLLNAPEPLKKPVVLPSIRELAKEYGQSQAPLLAPSYHYSQMMHLRHLIKFLDDRADASCDQISFWDLDRYLKKRLSERHPNTAERERITLMQFYKWVVQHGHLSISPAAALERIKGGEDRPPFRAEALPPPVPADAAVSDRELFIDRKCPAKCLKCANSAYPGDDMKLPLEVRGGVCE